MKHIISLIIFVCVNTFTQNEIPQHILGQAIENNKPKFINFKIKNNSLNRHQFVVIGTKPNGRKFSYGFPMMPLISRKEYWTTGTKIYKVNKMGLRKLLITIKPEDENKTIKLFKNKE